MKTTINKIKEFKPCGSGYESFLDKLGRDFDKDKEFEVSSLVGGNNTISDIIRLLGETENKRALIEFAVFCAELALPIYESENKSKAPREAVELVKKWLNNDSLVTRCELMSYGVAAVNDAAYTAYIACAAANTAYIACAAAYASYEAAADYAYAYAARS